jgi:hypothetical protein
MIDNQDEQRFELTENGFLAWAEDRIRDDKYIVHHV